MGLTYEEFKEWCFNLTFAFSIGMRIEHIVFLLTGFNLTLEVISFFLEVMSFFGLGAILP